jgi:hypothetical protein
LFNCHHREEKASATAATKMQPAKLYTKPFPDELPQRRRAVPNPSLASAMAASPIYPQGPATAAVLSVPDLQDAVPLRQFVPENAYPYTAGFPSGGQLPGWQNGYTYEQALAIAQMIDAARTQEYMQQAQDAAMAHAIAQEHHERASDEDAYRKYLLQKYPLLDGSSSPQDFINGVKQTQKQQQTHDDDDDDDGRDRDDSNSSKQADNTWIRATIAKQLETLRNERQNSTQSTSQSTNTTQLLL